MRESLTDWACRYIRYCVAAELLRGGGLPPSVRTLFLGGEALPPGLARALRTFNANADAFREASLEHERA